MHIAAVGWMYVVLMMAITEDSVVAGIMTFFFYGVLPTLIIIYIGGGRQRRQRREMERLVHPSSVGGSGATARRLRREGAEIAWIFFMLFAISIAVVTALLALTGLAFDHALVLTVAALSTTGPLSEVGAGAPIVLPLLPEAAKAILMAAMVLGRLETLALIALLNPDFWRS